MAQTYTDTSVNQLVINKLTKEEYDNLPQVSDTELYIVPEPITPEIVNGLYIIKEADASSWIAYPSEGTYYGIVEQLEPPIFYDNNTREYHTFTEEDNGKYFYDFIQDKMYMCQDYPNAHLYPVSDVGLFQLEGLDTDKLYLSLNNKCLYTTDDGEYFAPLNSSVSFTDESGTYTGKPSSNDNIQSGWLLSKIISRIKKWLASLGDLAFINANGDTSKYLRGDGTWNAIPSNITIWEGTLAQYNQISPKDPNTIYLISD